MDEISEEEQLNLGLPAEIVPDLTSRGATVPTDLSLTFCLDNSAASVKVVGVL